ncbi:pyridoxamine 5'-phosphate oxidase family protein [Pseudohalocynthiibacter aestuariivivens]|jgi:uncharacterized protein|uniref:Pyridoxamine 5'-phosphate oxidase family protein n=1 Tax=Pseudohalocynthiibacter aestuariivivens TaxID=1591409 RepID=A0ABV5JFF7_9RHOB|nr:MULTISPECIES: pyridoxamine 5'-phosphate oxidase family protein [Pseudohalocynthiibacter]MBS9717760.1 pyridoxamine 5'-phosphate oxidase family protein [Pseudohalocynthiibacter aestuariivivens]MCK0103090.1 pyridoxamine 5'-phosphate oxidase family protein [Pseudohalocynthiibacter sp. F2068]
MSQPFHRGEIEIQELTGERAMAAAHGRLIAGAIPRNALMFLAQQFYCVVGGEDKAGSVWAEFIAGDKGFAISDQAGKTLTLALDDASGPSNKASSLSGLRPGDNLGALFIELATKRRLRVNGTVSNLSSNKLVLSVVEAYPNCPKYIQSRHLTPVNTGTAQPLAETGEALTDEIRKWIKDADTFFVASAYPGGRADVSHRGGKPGFIRLQNDTLSIPDYPGNSMFGTLGNFAANPRAGIVFLDFEGNRQLRLSGEVVLDLKSGADLAATANTGRWWTFRPTHWTISPLNRTFESLYLDASPFNP